MGISANLLVNAKHNTQHIVTLLEGFGYHPKVDAQVDHAFLRFEDGAGHHYQLYVARSQEYGGLDGTILSLGSRPQSIALLRKIAAVIGGFLQEQDCDDDWVAHNDPHVNNAQFCLQHVILSQGIRSGEELVDKIKKPIGYK